MPPTYPLLRPAYLHDFAAAPRAAAVELDDPEAPARHVDPDDVDTALAAFDTESWKTQRPPEGWLVKSWHPNGALVDLIYNPASGPITNEQIERAPLAEVMAVRVHVSTLEDVSARAGALRL